MNKVCENYQKDNLKFIAALGVGSMILKDGLGCVMYVYQSLNNKSIPEDKRKFVASLDLANGGLMMLSQFLAFKTVSNRKVQEILFNKFFGKHFTEAAKKGYEAILKNNDKIKNLTGKEFNMEFKKFHKGVIGTFGLFATLISSTILAKRVIVPFISTPLAEHASKLLGKDKKPENKEAQDTFTKK